MKTTLSASLFVLCLPLAAFGYTAESPEGGADKEKELPKKVIEQKQNEVRSDKRFDAYSKSVGKKADALKKELDACKTEACFEGVRMKLETDKQKTRLSDPSSMNIKTKDGAPSGDGQWDKAYRQGSDAAGDAGRSIDGARKSVDSKLPGEAAKLKAGAFDGAAGSKLNSAGPGGGTKVSREMLDKARPLDFRSPAQSRTPASEPVKQETAAQSTAPAEQPKAEPAKAAAPKTQAEAPKPEKTFQSGDRGDDVKKLQKDINAYRKEQGLKPLKEDGVYGAKTEAARKQMQEGLGKDSGLADKMKVKDMQGKVNEFRERNGLDPIKKDGVPGKGTTQAIKDMQEKLGLEKTGVFDDATKARLAEELKKPVDPSAALGEPLKTAKGETSVYYPYRKHNSMEGGIKNRFSGSVNTIEKYLKGEAPYVSVAMDKNLDLPNGTRLRSADIDAIAADYCSRNACVRTGPIDLRVDDTGSAFTDKGYGRMDIATDSLETEKGTLGQALGSTKIDYTLYKKR
jgi:peptidoglycan hydrolase-like protein with peptidoglycan-binding domain